jgi:hypothetical protein
MIDDNRRINGFPVSELKPFLSKLQHDCVGLNAMMAMLLVANNIDAICNMMRPSYTGQSKDNQLREITANIIMLRTVLRSIETK